MRRYDDYPGLNSIDTSYCASLSAIWSRRASYVLVRGDAIAYVNLDVTSVSLLILLPTFYVCA